MTDLTANAVRADTAMRNLAHDAFVATHPPQTVYDVAGTLRDAGGYTLATVLNRLADNLLAATRHYQLWQDDGGDPRHAISDATCALRDAAELAEHLGRLIGDAQSALAWTSATPKRVAA